MTNEINLAGCRPVPLAHYLKALGVLRIVSKQKDPQARGAWRGASFILQTTLTREGLEHFFLYDYQPTPILSPWNGGSGFFEGDNQKALKAIHENTGARFLTYKQTIDLAREALKALGLTKKPEKTQKEELLLHCRSWYPEEALEWLDAAWVLTNEGPRSPPLLGTGGNDGRSEFSNQFMQQLMELFDSDGNPLPGSRLLAKHALFGEQQNLLTQQSPGQFFPQALGAYNATVGFKGSALLNPWDFVFLLEGAITFASSTTKRLNMGWAGDLASPFTVRQSGAGYGSSSLADESQSRAELWAPLWQQSITYRELTALFAEGRVRLRKRNAQTGLDFVQAIGGLGVDRGLHAFQRFGFQERNGRAYFAIPQGRFTVRREPTTDLLGTFDTWMQGFRKIQHKKETPVSVQQEYRRLEEACFALCKNPESASVQTVLRALGRCERLMATRFAWAQKHRLRPVPALPVIPWLARSDDNSPALRLAASLASVLGRYKKRERKVQVPWRAHMEPVRVSPSNDRTSVAWDSQSQGDVAWEAGNVYNALNQCFHRRLLKTTQSGHRHYQDRGYAWAGLEDITDFVEGTLDEEVFTELLWGCILLDWPQFRQKSPQERPLSAPPRDGFFPPAIYSILKLCFAGHPVREEKLPLQPTIHHLAAHGEGERACQAASQRLRGSGFVPAFGAPPFQGPVVQRAAAALAFPLTRHQTQILAARVLRPANH